MSKCTVCDKDVDWSCVKEEFEWIFEQADLRGMESLTDSEQVLVGGKVCSSDCLNRLEEN